MKPDIAPAVAERLIAEYGAKCTPDGWLRQGRCPQCAQKELYTHSERPWVIRCGRLNNCGYEATAKELFPDLYQGWTRRFQPTDDSPNATADAYLREVRGFPIERIQGWYRQGRFWHPKGDKGTATVRFDLAEGVWMERLIEEVAIGTGAERQMRKAHFEGSHKGLWWAPPGMRIEDGDEVWLVEGCLDAIALHLSGAKAVATLSCVNYPAKSLEPHQEKRVTWVWALDSDAAGQRFLLKHAAEMRKARLSVAAAQIPQPGSRKIDWNDLYQRGELDEERREEYRYQGALLIARSATEKALLIYEHEERQEFPFEYRSRLWYFSLNVERFRKAHEALVEQNTGLSETQIKEAALRESGGIQEIANCYPRALYYMANEVTDEAWYYYRIAFPHGKGAVRNTFTGAQLASASEFKKRLLAVAAGSLFTGTSQQLDRLLRGQLYGIKTVETIDYVGYAKAHQAWVWPEVAVREGRSYRLNDEDFFDLGSVSVKSITQSLSLAINTDRDGFQTDWVEQLWRCYGTKGMVALAFWLGSLFAEQIRDLHKSYPFLEVVGEPGSGKSTLIEFLWKLCGRRDYEGFDPAKSTFAGRARNFAQVANLPVVLIEADRGEEGGKMRAFDWDELKTAYNGRSVRARGHRNAGNETYEPPFRGALVISQNHEVQASEAILQRIVHLDFDRSAHTHATKAVAETLERTPIEAVSGFCLRACQAERRVMEIFREQYRGFEQEILRAGAVRSVRIAKNHAQIAALLHALDALLPLPAGVLAETEAYILTQLTAERQQAINADHPIVAEFWEVYDYLNGEDPKAPKLNHSRNGVIAINLNHFLTVADGARQQVPPMIELKRHLRSSKSHKFIGIRAVSSALWEQGMASARTVKCWTFTQ